LKRESGVPFGCEQVARLPTKLARGPSLPVAAAVPVGDPGLRHGAQMCMIGGSLFAHGKGTEMERLIFQEHPTVVICTNTFVQVDIPLQFDDTPLIEVGKFESTDFTTRIPIFHSDGTKLAMVVGAQLHLTKDGEKAGLKLRHPDKLTVCELGGQTLFEIQRDEAASISATAELYTPDGYLVKCSDAPKPVVIKRDGSSLRIGGLTMQGCTLAGHHIGIHLRSEGGFSLGVGRSQIT
jgi:hypothetical protein